MSCITYSSYTFGKKQPTRQYTYLHCCMHELSHYTQSHKLTPYILFSTYAYILIYMQVFTFFSMFMFAVLAVLMCILAFKWDPELVQTLKKKVSEWYLYSILVQSLLFSLHAIYIQWPWTCHIFSLSVHWHSVGELLFTTSYNMDVWSKCMVSLFSMCYFITHLCSAGKFLLAASCSFLHFLMLKYAFICA